MAMWVRSGYSVCHGLHVVQVYTFAVKAQWLVYVDQILTLKFLRSAVTLYLYILYGSQNTRRLFPFALLTGWFLLPRRSMFTARYELNL